jgi:2-(1,2-epoxy-1,2-dihydrophenyl)acetyl-CoA isomerase
MSTILTTKQGPIATISFHRPEAMNSLNEIMAQELHSIITEFTNDPDLRVIILRGTGKLFMAGGDVAFFHRHLSDIEQKVHAVISQVHQVVQMIQQSDKIIIAAVHGSVAGIGVSFMLAADLVIAADDTKFTLAYSKIGATPDGGVTFTLPRIVGTKKAMELALLSDVFDAKMAKTYGLINWVVKSEELEQETINIATHIASGPAFTYANIKHLINNTWERDLAGQLKAEEKSFIAVAKTEDFRRGVTAFVMKSKVEFC